RRDERRRPSPTRRRCAAPEQFAGAAPSVTVTGVAKFGGPIAPSSDAGFNFRQTIVQALDNFTVIPGNHDVKAGFNTQFVHDERTSALFQLYAFPTINAYLLAQSGADPRSYRAFQ